MRLITLLTVGLLAAAVAPRAEGQFLKRVQERVKQKVAERKQQTQDNLIAHAAESADSAIERAMSPVDSVAARAGGKAGSIVGGVGRGPGSKLDAELQEQLAAGRADLTGMVFVPGSEALDPASEPTLQSLARALASASSVYLIQGRADAGTTDPAAHSLADLRASAIKNWLIGQGVPGQQIFAAGDGAALPGASLATLVPMR